MTDVKLKTGQVAAVLGIPPKQLQNDVEAGYVKPSIEAKGRGSIRLYNLENVVQIKILDLLVQAYGLDRQQAATLLRRAWPGRFPTRDRVLVIPLASNASREGIDLEPIRLPLREIVNATKRRIDEALVAYHEKKRERPVRWSVQMPQALTDVSEALQAVSDDQIRQEIGAYRAARRDGAREVLRPRWRGGVDTGW